MSGLDFSSTQVLAAALEDRVRDVLGSTTVSVYDLRRLSGGASRETWTFAAREPAGREHRLILRRDPPTEPRPVEMRREAVALSAALKNGVPSPDLVDWSDSGAAVGAPYLMVRHVDGETIARRILRESRYATARERLARDFGQAAGLIHRIPMEEVAGIPEVDMLSEYRERYLALDVPRPVLDLAFRWLEENRPPATRETRLVHGDFRLGNVIVDDTGLRAVLDWELTHRGDPMEDLGYLCIRAWRFGGPLPVAGVGHFRDLFAAYEEVTGTPVDPDIVRWWQILGTLTWGVICLIQAHRHLDGTTRSVELAAVGRRTAEQEFDLLHMITPVR